MPSGLMQRRLQRKAAAYRKAKRRHRRPLECRFGRHRLGAILLRDASTEEYASRQD